MVDVVKDRKETRINEKLSPLFLSLVVLITVCLLALSFYLRVSYFYSTDKAFIYEQVTPKVLKQFEGFPDLITVGLNIEQFQVFDVAKDNFEFSGTLWFSMGKGSLSLETLEKFRFDRGTILHRSEPNMSISRNSIIVRYLVRVAFNSGLNFQDFPLDDHLVTLILSNPFLEPEEALFDTSTANFTIDSELQPFGWELNTKSARTGFASVHLSEQQNSFVFSQPVVQFSLEVERYGIRFLLTILLPIILIFCIMCFSLALEPTQSLSIASGGVTAIIAYRFVIEQLSPKSGDLMLSDNFFFLILAGALMLFVLISLDIFLGGLKMYVKKISLVVINLFILGVSITLLLP
ncbi:MAG: hypothetical protein KC505_04915 [Myxococcales bacterium]|nr:hypothetical protein [Myxococcales bacterium]USN50568.1 MAG: hypothetical protein H6731_09945 [Myxococcales bacterium]